MADRVGCLSAPKNFTQIITMSDEIEQFLAVCQQASRAAGGVLQSWVGRFQAQEKGPSDLVTEADLAAQLTVQEHVRAEFPDHGWLAEEAGGDRPSATGYRWIVDPLDGTANFVHGYPNYAVSLALEHEGRLLVGCVYDPAADECFTAAAGRGAWLNGKRLYTSGVAELSRAMIAASFPAKVPRGDRLIDEFAEILVTAQATRRTGSAALNLSYVACGRFDGYWARDNKAWDVAAGILLVREAGGAVEGIERPDVPLEHPQLLAGATPELVGQLRGVVARVSRK